MSGARQPSFRIGELSARCGRSVHAIRWYEAQGLIPGVLRDTGGRRVYNTRHVGWLTLMERLRITGMSVAQMRHYTQLVVQGRSTLAERRRMLAEHRQAVEARIADYRRALALIDRKIGFYDEWIDSGQRPEDPIAPDKPH